MRAGEKDGTSTTLSGKRPHTVLPIPRHNVSQFGDILSLCENWPAPRASGDTEVRARPGIPRSAEMGIIRQGKRRTHPGLVVAPKSMRRKGCVPMLSGCWLDTAHRYEAGYLFAGDRGIADYDQLVRLRPHLRDRPQQRHELQDLSRVLARLPGIPTPRTWRLELDAPLPDDLSYPHLRTHGTSIMEVGRRSLSGSYAGRARRRMSGAATRFRLERADSCPRVD